MFWVLLLVKELKEEYNIVFYFYEYVEKKIFSIKKLNVFIYWFLWNGFVLVNLIEIRILVIYLLKFFYIILNVCICICFIYNEILFKEVFIFKDFDYWFWVFLGL